MKTIQKLLSAILVLSMVLSMAAMMAGCDPKTEDTSESTAPSGDNAATGTYNVNVTTMGGMAMPGIDVYIYADSTLSDMKAAKQTGENGFVSVDLPLSSDYAVAISGAPKGYAVEASYSFVGNTCNIVLTSSLITGQSISGASLGVGDVMYDFSVTTPAGDTLTLSELLKEKDMVLLNFWYDGCSACELEFPYMEEAYQLYKDDIEIVAVSPYDDNTTISLYQSSMGLSFPMASCNVTWPSAFATSSISYYPTSVIIDRYGVICMVEEGALTALKYFTSIFDHFTGDDYQQTLITDLEDLVTRVKPTHTMDTSENIGAVINGGDIEVTYRGDEDEYSWPFVITEKNGEACLMATNQGIDDSYAILYADVTMKAGQAVAFDYLASTEYGGDVLYVIVDGEDIYAIHGYDDVETWKTCYPWVAEEDGTYEVALCYLKDSSIDEADDTVYVKNLRIVDAADIDAATYIPHNAATTEDGFEWTYADVFYNEKDGYYHVDSVNGPLLLADLMNYSQFSEDETIWDIVYDGRVTVDGESIYNDMVNYFSYASNSSLSGVCTVNKELADLLKIVAQQAGFDGTENEWLKICRYYKAYGTKEQLVDPIKGLAPFSAYEATLGKNKESNSFTYNGIIMPRGYLAKFVPTKSGVYRITSRNESADGVEGWIFDENRVELYCYQHAERMYEDDLNVSMVFYMEAGKAYYIDIAFWDYYQVGTIYYDIEYVASTYKLFRLASPGYFTYDSDATGDEIYYTIAGGIDVILKDGKYYEDLGADGTGSLLYVDFTGITPIFDAPISTVTTKDSSGKTITVKGLIDKGAFDFSKTEDDLYILNVMELNNNDEAATIDYLKNLWGENYEANAADYQIEDVFAGKYHGEGEDLTEEIKTYLDDIIKSGSEEKIGCVVVTERLAEILQMLMDKYTFKNVDHSWTKLCYYYDYLGPEG